MAPVFIKRKIMESLTRYMFNKEYLSDCRCEMEPDPHGGYYDVEDVDSLLEDKNEEIEKKDKTIARLRNQLDLLGGNI